MLQLSLLSILLQSGVWVGNADDASRGRSMMNESQRLHVSDQQVDKPPLRAD